MIATETINDVRNCIDIVDIIGSYVDLKKKGKNYTGLCPFHEEKTSSFVVNQSKQLYHCFGCGAGGDVFEFLQRYKKLSFYESLQELATRAGISLGYQDSIKQYNNNKKDKILYGLDFSKDEIRKIGSAIIVDTANDFNALFNNGIKNVVATEGIITGVQVRLLSRYTKKFILFSNCDAVDMVIKTLKVIIENNCDAEIISIQDNEDVDLFILQYGINTLKKIIDRPTSFIGFIYDAYNNAGRLDTTKRKFECLNNLLCIFTNIKDKLLLEFYLKDIARIFGIDTTIIRMEFDSIKQKFFNEKFNQKFMKSWVVKT